MRVPVRSSAVVAVLLALGALSARADEPRKRRRAPAPVAEPATEESPPAPADPAPADTARPAPPPWKLTPPGGKPVLTAHVYEEGALPTEVGDALAAIDASLSKDTRFQYRDLAELLEPPEDGRAAISDAHQALKEANASFDQMDLDNARGKLEGAIKSYERYLALLGAEEGDVNHLRDAWIRLAAVRFFDGNNDGAREALRHVFVLDPKLTYSGKVFPPQMKKAVIESRLLFDALGSGKIRVESDPAGATVFVNGTMKGLSPVTVEDAPPGPNYVTLIKRGWSPVTSLVEVNGGGDESRHDQTLTRYDSDPIQPFIEARVNLGAVEAPPQLLEAMRRARVDLVALFQVGKDAGRKVTAHLYDARTKRLLRQSVKTGSTDQLGETARQAAAELFDGTRLDGVYVPPPPPKKVSPLAEAWERVVDGFVGWRNWKYFWHSVGVGGGVIVAAVVVGVAVGVAPKGGGRTGPTPAQEVVLLGGGGGRALQVVNLGMRFSF